MQNENSKLKIKMYKNSNKNFKIRFQNAKR